MHPVHYVRTHWHAMVVGAVVWHFVGPWVLGYAGQVTGGMSKQ